MRDFRNMRDYQDRRDPLVTFAIGLLVVIAVCLVILVAGSVLSSDSPFHFRPIQYDNR